MLHGLSSDLAHVCVDFRRYAESYYFHEADEDISLAANSTCLASLAEQLPNGAGQPEATLARELLRVSRHNLAVTLDERFLHTGGSAWQVLSRYAQDHGRAAKG